MRHRLNSILIFAFITCLMFIFIGCSDLENIKRNTNITLSQREYLNQKGYKIISSKGITDSYILEKEMLKHLPYANIWGLQDIYIQNYFSKTIDIYSYIVNNHKLDTYGDMNETLVWLIVCKDEIIGGYSLPNNTEPLCGGVYSIDGKTLEEVTGMDFQTWQTKWQEKYN